MIGAYYFKIKEAHLFWGEKRNSSSRPKRENESYIPIPAAYAYMFEIKKGKIYKYKSPNGRIIELLASGVQSRKEYAKQFQGKGDLSVVFDWFKAQSINGEIENLIGNYVVVSLINEDTIDLEYVSKESKYHFTEESGLFYRDKKSELNNVSNDLNEINQAKFRVKARTIEILGREQIRDSITALNELMKNSYDADASELYVNVENNSSNPKVVVVDNGTGMSSDDIQSKWLFIGTNSKTYVKKKKSANGRTLLGAKGIGRLASASIGNQILLITKTEKSKWNLIFVDWRIFENPNLYIEDVIIPALFEVEEQYLFENFNEIICKLKDKQYNNLRLDAWADFDYENEREVEILLGKKALIKKDLDSFSLMKDDFDKYYDTFDTLDSGTFIFITSLNDSWDEIVNPNESNVNKESRLIDSKHDKLGAFLADFNGISQNKDDPFVFNFFYNDEPVEINYNFNDEDYKLFDVKVEGEIEFGIFKGKLSCKNIESNLLNECNRQLNEGIELTSGILNPENVDCGKFKIKFCHIEGLPSRSSLCEEDYNLIRKKLDYTRGMCIYRDGIRVLPYGDTSNDFLLIDYRRNLRHSTYIFSNSYLFGRIDISSDENPNLVDKSSREGLIENDQFYFLINVVQKLLIIVATRFLAKGKYSFSLRDNYISKNLNEYNKRQAIEKIQTEYEKKYKIFIKEINKKLESEDANVKTFTKNIGKKFSEIRVNLKKIESVNEIKILTMLEREIEDSLNEVKSTIESFYSPIIIDDFESMLEDEQLTDVYNYNYNLNKNKVDSECTLNTLSIEAKKLIEIRSNLILNSFKSEITISDMVVDLNHRLEMLKNKMQDTEVFLEELDDDFYNSTQSDVESVKKWIFDFENKKKDVKSDSFSLLTKRLADISKSIELVQVSSMEESRERYVNVSKKIKELETEIDRLTSESIDRKASDNKEKSKKIESVMHVITAEGLSYDELEILCNKKLKETQKQLDLYTDLANTGLATEIVSHEFYQLFNNVNNSIEELRSYSRSNDELYYLREISLGVKAIKERLNQLTPMYRSYNLRKTKTNLYSMVNGICRFMDKEAEKEKINFIIDIPENIELKISQAKLFPAISNIVTNSFYWVRSSNIKIVRFRYSEKEEYDNERKTTVLKRILYIEDSGPGIEKYLVNKIFEPFYSERPNGRGLGLTITKRVLESQGHKIEVGNDMDQMELLDNERLNGACFKIIFSEDA